jgi:hypothetical protein
MDANSLCAPCHPFLFSDWRRSLPLCSLLSSCWFSHPLSKIYLGTFLHKFGFDLYCEWMDWRWIAWLGHIAKYLGVHINFIQRFKCNDKCSCFTYLLVYGDFKWRIQQKFRQNGMLLPPRPSDIYVEVLAHNRTGHCLNNLGYQIL